VALTPDRVLAADAALASVLPAESLHAVGGRVRDEVRTALDGVARPAKDLDYVATGLELDDLVARLQRLGRADVVGASFAVVKVTFDGLTVDVALPRRERSTGVGHRDFVVEAGSQVTLEDDLGRRDFRMNMLARALPSGALVDPYGGEADIRGRRIDLLRPQAFEEDPLRMLRAAQFAARLEFAITPQTMAAMRASAPLIGSVSAERIHDELVKLLDESDRPSIGFEIMREGGLLEILFPEIAEGIGVEQNEYHAYDIYRHTLATLDATPPGNLGLRIGALLHDVGKPRTKDGPHFYRHEVLGEELTRQILGRFRFSNELIEDVAALVRHHMYVADPAQADATVRRFVRRIGSDRLEDQFALRRADVIGSGLPKRGSNEAFEERVREIVAQQPPLTVKALAIGGADVIGAAVERGLLPDGSRGGPLVGEVLQSLLERVIEQPELNEPAALREEMSRLLAAREAPR
jgi:tRNA nucleotidyltransferase/poly(A) polymerase